MFRLRRIHIPLAAVILALMLGCASDQKKAETFLTEAEAYFQKQDYQKALIQIKNCIKLAPRSVKAHDLLAKTHFKLKDATSGYKALLRLEQLDPENLDTKIEVATFNMLARNLTEAQSRVDAVLQKSPDHVQALFLQAGLLSQKKEEMAKIIPVYRKILDIDPGQTKAHMALSAIYVAEKQRDLAEKELKAALDKTPEDMGIYRSLYGLYRAENAPEKARSLLELMVENLPDQSEPLILLGSHLISRGRSDAARQALEKAVETEPDNINPHVALARLFNAQGAPDKAESHIQKAVAIDPDNHELKLLQADFYFSQKDLDQAENLVDTVLAQRPNLAMAKALKGKILIQNREFAKAIPLFQELVKDEPDLAPYNFFLGNAMLRAGRQNEGLSYISRTIELNPNHVPARMIMADSHYKNRDYFLAETEVNQVLRAMPDNYNANILLGNIHGSRKEYDKARAVFERLIEMDPKAPAAYYRLGLTARAQKDNADALAQFNKALELNPKLMDVFTQVIAIYADKKEFQRAIERCNAHMESVRDSPIAEAIILNLKANLLFTLKKVEAAKTNLAEAIEKNPAYITPYMTLGQIHSSQGKYEDAIALYKVLAEERPDQPSPHSLMGTLYEKTGRLDLAETHYKKALEINPNFIPALNNLAYFYAEQNRELDQALDLARRAKERLGRVTAVMDTLGWVLYKKELYPSAVGEFEACVEKEPNNPIFHFHLGLAYNKMWKFDKARAALSKALEIQKDFKGSDEARKILGQI